jgi:hypothetical protein
MSTTTQATQAAVLLMACIAQGAQSHLVCCSTFSTRGMAPRMVEVSYALLRSAVRFRTGWLADLLHQPTNSAPKSPFCLDAPDCGFLSCHTSWSPPRLAAVTSVKRRPSNRTPIAQSRQHHAVYMLTVARGRFGFLLGPFVACRG